jgi:hypothetical protein
MVVAIIFCHHFISCFQLYVVKEVEKRAKFLICLLLSKRRSGVNLRESLLSFPAAEGVS